MTHKEWCDLHPDTLPDYSYPLECSCDVPHYQRSAGTYEGKPLVYWKRCERREGERRKGQRAFSKLLKPTMRGPDRRKRDD